MNDVVRRPAVPGRPAPGSVALRDLLGFVAVTRSVTGRPVYIQPAFQQLRSSTSTSEDLTANPPAVLLRGTVNVLIEARTNPPNQAVTWEIRANGHTGAAPALSPTEGGRKAIVRGDRAGAFAVVASVPGGAAPMIYNLVFVDVAVTQTADAVRLLPGREYRQIAPGVPFVQVQVGNTDQTPPRPGWTAKASVQLTGGGASGDLGVDQIQLQFLHNGTTDDIVASYLDRTTMKVLRVREVVAKFPVVDTDDLPDVRPQRKHFPSPTNKNAVDISPPTGRQRAITFFDSPMTLPFPLNHPNHKDLLIGSLDGSMGFRAAIAAISAHAPHTVVVYAIVAWSANVTGAIEVEADHHTPPVLTPRWSPVSATGGTSDPQFTIVAGGSDAADQGFEIWPPNFMQEVQSVADP